MYHNTLLRKRANLFLVVLLLAGNLPAPSSRAAVHPAGNGIFVGQTKLYDERSLAVMFYALQAKLANRDFFDQGGIAAAIGKFQGARLDASSLGFNLMTTPIPGVSTKTNTGSTTEFNEKVTQPAVAAGATPGLPGVETTTKVTSPDTVDQNVTQPAVTPTAAGLPPQPSAFAFQPPFGLSPQTLLAQQIELTHSLDNLRLMLEGSLTDRTFTAPLTLVTPLTKGRLGQSIRSPRLRAVVGFEITLDSPKHYENAAAEVEITLTTQKSDMEGAPSIVTVLPKENNYNVATVTKDAKQFGFGVAVQPINLGLSTQTQKETLYLVQDLDTVSFERSHPINADAPPPKSITFGWQFRPVLGQKVVKAGPRRVFAVLALPSSDLGVFVGKVQACTFWRKYDSKKKTVGDLIKKSDICRQLDNFEITGALSEGGEPLQPEPIEVDWLDVGQGNILVTSRGSFYLPGMGIVLGNQLIDTAEKGLFLQSDTSFRWLVSGQRLALMDDALLAGRFGPPRKLRDPVAQNDTNARHLTITQVTTSPLDAQNSKVRVELSFTSAPDFSPIIILGSKAYGFSDAPLVKIRNSRTVRGGRIMEVEFVAPSQTLRDATKLTARILFFGRDYTAERQAASFTPSITGSSIANKLITLSTNDQATLFAIMGSGFATANVKVNVGGVELQPNTMPGRPGTNGAVLTLNDSTLLTLSLPRDLTKTAKQITLMQSGNAPILLPLTAPAPVPPKPKITNIEAVSVGDQVYVKVSGENLGSIEKVLFQDIILKTKNVSDDGKTMELLVTKEMSESRGRRSIDFVSKDGTETSGDLIVKP